MKPRIAQISDTEAWVTYSPTFTNVTSGAGSFAYLRRGKSVKIRGSFSAGTATAAAAVRVSLPPGQTVTAPFHLNAGNNNAAIGANVITTEVRIFADLAAANWGVGASLSLVHFNGEYEIA